MRPGVSSSAEATPWSAIAATATQGVVAPETCGIGGDLFALVHLGGWEQPRALNASGRAGSNADPELHRGLEGTPETTHFLSLSQGVSTVGQRSPPSWADCR